VTFDAKGHLAKSRKRVMLVWPFEHRTSILERAPVFALLCASSKQSYRLPQGSLCTLPFSAKSMKLAEFRHIRRTWGAPLEWLGWLSREEVLVLRAQKACLRRGPELLISEAAFNEHKPLSAAHLKVWCLQ
jgi:hypothetical protein